MSNLKNLDNATKKNLALQVIDGALFNAGMVFFHPLTIMVAFVKRTYDIPILSGLVSTFLNLGVNLPALFTSMITERFKKRKSVVMVTAFFQRLFPLLIALSTFFITGDNSVSRVVVTISLVFYFLFAFSGGCGMSAWLDLYAKTIPLEVRSRVTALRNSFGGIAGIILPVGVSLVLSAFMYPLNYRILFFSGWILMAISMAALFLLKEKEDSPVHNINNFRRYMGLLTAILKRDANFRKLVISRVILSFYACGTAFYTVYAIDTFHVSDSTIAMYTLVLNLSITIGSLVIGYIGDKLSNLLVYKLGTLTAVLELVLILVFASPVTLFIVFMLNGITTSAMINTGVALVPEFCDEKSRLRYNIISSFTAGIFTGFTPLLGGLLLTLHIMDYKSLFLFCAVITIISLVYTCCTVKEPRGMKKQ